MNICFLIVDYVPHQISSIKTLIGTLNTNILAFHQGRLVKEVPINLVGLTTIQAHTLSKNQMLEKIRIFDAHIIVTAGWMFPEYTWICRKIKKTRDIPIVAMSDTPWYGTWTQKINSYISRFYLKKAFTHLWVAGIRQYDYARKLGFESEKIIFNLLSADVANFSKISIEGKKLVYPKNFIYVGRYTEIKGLRNLIKAWSSIENKKGWIFTLIGAGDMKNELEQSNQFIVKNYMTQDEIVHEMNEAGCFVLPSLHEPWAVVLHEAAIAGLPIICTETCGAAPHFVINNYNGFKIKNNSIEDLQSKLEIIINTEDSKIIEYSMRSRRLSSAINLEIHEANLRQLINAK